MARRQLGWSEKPTSKVAQKHTINASIASPDVPELPADLFSVPPVLTQITSLRQRLNNPAQQPERVANLYPQHKSLSIKRSVRCRQCEHYVIKPEYNPISIKYRIHLLASYHVPEVRMMKNNRLRQGESAQIMLKFINPTMHDMNITISPLPTREEELQTIEELRKKFKSELQLSTDTTGGSVAASPFSTLPFASNEVPKLVEQEISGTVVIPEVPTFVVNHRDDTAEFDDDAPELDEPKCVVWRRSNKVAVELTVNPLASAAGDAVVVGFVMTFNYLNTFPNTPDKKDPQEHALSSRVYIKVGNIVN